VAVIASHNLVVLYFVVPTLKEINVHTCFYASLPLTADLQQSPLASFDPISALDGTSRAGFPEKKS
jgi:hypothetical protein